MTRVYEPSELRQEAFLYKKKPYHWCFLGDIGASRLESWKAVQHVAYILEPAEPHMGYPGAFLKE